MFELPKLDYSKSALSPIMSEQTLNIMKSIITNITNLNNFIKSSDMKNLSLREIQKSSTEKKQVYLIMLVNIGITIYFGNYETNGGEKI